MKRTQIYLDENLLNYLKAESIHQGKRMSRIIRDILMKSFKNKTKNTKFVDDIFGLWKDKSDDVDSQIRILRKNSRKYDQ